MKTITVLGGEIMVVREQYGVNYGVNVQTHPYFAALKETTRLLILEACKRRVGTVVFMGGCAEWTPEQFLNSVKHVNNVSDALCECLCENNYISAALGVKDYDAAKANLTAYREQRLARIRAALAQEAQDAEMAPFIDQGDSEDDLPF